MRPVPSAMCIDFCIHTIVQQVVGDDWSIPLNKFDLLNVVDVYAVARGYARDQVPINTIDVIGVVDNPGQVKTVPTRTGEKQVHCFNMTDGMCSIKVSVWEDMIASTIDMFEMDLQQPIVLILSSVRLHMFMYSPSIVTLPYSRIYVNPDMEEAVAMRQRYADVIP
ncbi:hypothetical protein POM88_001056 [Heracleum sosnowskyi]|uniref:Replication protein A OB domain-containing protein n=1 Tax=Heracleum sosnowskyi TaxID=360622 RepID=A0AAD8JCZ2_9APIA|nr:hypothetical protein POM88_001056 [Heracleum sosnowskyi]